MLSGKRCYRECPVVWGVCSWVCDTGRSGDFDRDPGAKWKMWMGQLRHSALVFSF